MICKYRQFLLTFVEEQSNPMPNIIIAIDGCSSTGKSSFARLVASKFGFLYLDSGALYRGVTLFAREEHLISRLNNVSPALEKALETLDLHFEQNGKTYIGARCVEQQIRTMEVSSQVSPIAAVPYVRAFVDKKLREFGRKGRVVMDGRDIGTAVFPDAQLKIFMTASEEVRARRRYEEMARKGSTDTYEQVLEAFDAGYTHITHLYSGMSSIRRLLKAVISFCFSLHNAFLPCSQQAATMHFSPKGWPLLSRQPLQVADMGQLTQSAPQMELLIYVSSVSCEFGWETDAVHRFPMIRLLTKAGRGAFP